MEERDAGQDRSIRVLGGTVLVGVIIGLVLLVARLAYIQTQLGPQLLSWVAEQQTGSVPVPARRGFILDRVGRVVAGTQQKPSVFADPGLVEDVVDAASRLAPILDLPAGAIEQTLRENSFKRFCWLKRMIEPADARAVTALRLRGVGLEDEPQRFYPMESVMAPVIGIVGREGQGLEGLELQYDSWLRGQDGKRTSIYDGRRKRRPIWSDDEASVAPVDGGHVVLTIDCVIQSWAETALSEAVKRFEARAGVAVVLSPKTGELLAVAQVPTFDPNHYQRVSAEARRSMAICDGLEPGSTFKPYVASGAVLARVIGPDEQIYCHQGEHSFGRQLIHDTSPQGHLTFAGIIAKSSNIGMGILGDRMGNLTIHNIVRAFGFGEATGIAFPGESPGYVRPLPEWTSYSTHSVPIGQELRVTPLQLVSAFGAIVNGGMLLQPRMVKAKLSSDGEVAEATDGPRRVRQVLPPNAVERMKEVLVGAVKDGGGKAAALADWQVCGKTGTAQIAYTDRVGYEPGAYVSSFTAAAPAEDPAIVVLVMIHRPNPSIGYYGRLVSAPVAREIMSRTLPYLQVPPSPREVMTAMAEDDSEAVVVRMDE